MPELVTIPGVTILRTGTYQLASGARTFAEEDLTAAAAALQNDPGVKAPRIKIDSLAKAMGLDASAHGGEPAFGWADNLTVAGNGQEIIADLHVPQWIAEAMPWAYPALSIEGTPRGWTSATGRTHEFVITAVALLGVDWPGVTTLDDFREIMANGPDLVPTEDGAVVAKLAPRPRQDVQASLDHDLVVRHFIDDLDAAAIDPPEGTASPYDLWPRTMRFDDNGQPYLKVTNEVSGRLYRVDFEVTGTDVTFSDFAEIVEQDVPIAAAAAIPSRAVASWASRAAAASSSPSTPDQEDEHPMNDALRRILAARHGLDPETATEDEIMAAENTAAETPPPDEGNGESGEGEGAPAGETEGAEGEQVPAGVAARMVTVSRETWEQTQAQAADGVQARAEQVRVERDTIVSAAIRDGRITPAEAGMTRQADGSLPNGWRRDLDDAPDVTARALARLEAGKYPGAQARQALAPTEGVSARSAAVLASIRGPESNTDRKVTHR